jgi:hypothetical protein
VENYRELAGMITDLMAEDDRDMTACLEKRGIDHVGFKKRMLEYLEKRKSEEGKRKLKEGGSGMRRKK